MNILWKSIKIDDKSIENHDNMNIYENPKESLLSSDIQPSSHRVLEFWSLGAEAVAFKLYETYPLHGPGPSCAQPGQGLPGAGALGAQGGKGSSNAKDMFHICICISSYTILLVDYLILPWVPKSMKSIKMIENKWKSMKIHKSPWESIQISENHRKTIP